MQIQHDGKHDLVQHLNLEQFEQLVHHFLNIAAHLLLNTHLCIGCARIRATIANTQMQVRLQRQERQFGISRGQRTPLV